MGADSDQRTLPALPQGIINTPVALSTDARINGAGDVSWTPSLDTRVNRLTVDILAGPDGIILNGQPVAPARIIAQSRGTLRDPATDTFNLSDLSDPNKFFNPENYQPAVNDQFVIRLRYEIRDFTRVDEDGQSISSQISRSSKFISVNVPPIGAPDVFLPTIDKDGVLNFGVAVVNDELYYFDPEYATGYDYIVDSGPNFGSVLIPGALPGGDSLFDLLVPGFGTYALLAGIEFDLTSLDPLGFSNFGIRGIDVAELLDPGDPLAFVTGLTFVDSGPVSMRMIPVTTDVPEPATLLLFGIGLAGMGYARKKRKSA